MRYYAEFEVLMPDGFTYTIEGDYLESLHDNLIGVIAIRHGCVANEMIAVVDMTKIVSIAEVKTGRDECKNGSNDIQVQGD